MSDYASCEIKRPLVRMVRRPTASLLHRAIVYFIALIGALLTGALLIFILGHNPLDVYVSMVQGTFGRAISFNETIKVAVPLLVTGMAVAMAFRMRFWNIGAEGQILIGGIASTAIVIYGQNIPQLPKLILMGLAAMLAAGLYAAIPALFKAKWDTNETLFTLMMNYIALQLILFLQYQKGWQKERTSFPIIRTFSPDARLPRVYGIHIGWIIALVLVILYFIYVKKTKHGYEVSVIGESVNTARYAGMNVGKVIIRTMFISGALAGLVGFIQTAGADGTLGEGTAGGMGYTAITVAWLSKMNSIAMVFVSFFIAMLDRGAKSIQTSHGIPASAAALLTGLILFFMLGSEFFINYKLVFRGRAYHG